MKFSGYGEIDVVNYYAQLGHIEADGSGTVTLTVPDVTVEDGVHKGYTLVYSERFVRRIWPLPEQQVVELLTDKERQKLVQFFCPCGLQLKYKWSSCSRSYPWNFWKHANFKNVESRLPEVKKE